MDPLVSKYIANKEKQVKKLERELELSEAYYESRTKLVTRDLSRYRREIITGNLVNCKQEIHSLKKKLDKLYLMQDVERIVNEEKA